MAYILAFSLAFTVALVVMLIGELIPTKSKAVRERLAEVAATGLDARELLARRDRQRQREQLVSLLQQVGSRFASAEAQGTYQEFLMHAGFRHPNAAAIFWGLRIILATGLGALMAFLFPLLGFGSRVTLFAIIYFAAMGWVVPVLWLRSRRKARQKEVQLALADALDLLVVCVEAGLGLNHALQRVADEIRHVSTILSAELNLVNVEVRAGIAREQALRNLADRTGVEDVRSLVTMLVQTDRFGTSIARALRVHSDTLRMKRRQRAEEAAAKTAIKMVFPLVFCIFPALFVVILAPGLMQIFDTLRGMA